MSNGNWYPSTSDYALGLSGNTRLYPFGHYDSSGAYIGAETELEIDPQVTVNLPGQDSDFSIEPYTGSGQPFSNT